MNDHVASVLIIDDDEVDRYLMKRQLKQTELNLQVFEVCDGQEALDFFKNFDTLKAKFGDQYPPLISFLDINMPRKNGLEFLDDFAEFRSEVTEMITIFIMVSSARRAEEERRALRHDFVEGYLTKGDFESRDLRSLLDQIISRKPILAE